MKRIVPLVLAASLTACEPGTFGQFDIDGTQSARMDASQRVLLVTNRGGRDGNRHVVCAEPSPDSLATMSLAIQAEAKAKEAAATAGAAQAEQTASFGSSFSQSAAFVGMRTQTIQLLRDGLYRACEAYMNGAIDEVEYNILLVNMPKVMTALIAIDGLTARPAAPAVVVAGPSVSTTKDGTTTVTGSTTTKLDAAGKPTEVTTGAAVLTPAAMGGERLGDNTVAAVYGIAQTIQQAPSMPAACVALLNNHGTDTYRTDKNFLILQDYCRATLRRDVARDRPLRVPNLPGLAVKTAKAPQS